MFAKGINKKYTVSRLPFSSRKVERAYGVRRHGIPPAASLGNAPAPPLTERPETGRPEVDAKFFGARNNVVILPNTHLKNPAMLNARFESAEATFVAGTIWLEGAVLAFDSVCKICEALIIKICVSTGSSRYRTSTSSVRCTTRSPGQRGAYFYKELLN